MAPEDLIGILRGCAGEREDVVLDPDALGMAFDDLGYDSVALLEVTARIQNEHGVPLDDDVLDRVSTPLELLAEINIDRSPQAR